MPRVPESHLRFRTKEQICEDVAFVLNAPLSYGTKFAVLADVNWAWSEFRGKFKGCQYWSKAALKIPEDTKMLVHEHLVPKSIIIKKLMALEAPTHTNIRTLLDRYCIGVVVTREEDARLTSLGLRSEMPDDWDGLDPWARYTVAKIKVDR